MQIKKKTESGIKKPDITRSLFITFYVHCRVTLFFFLKTIVGKNQCSDPEPSYKFGIIGIRRNGADPEVQHCSLATFRI